MEQILVIIYKLYCKYISVRNTRKVLSFVINISGELRACYINKEMHINLQGFIDKNTEISYIDLFEYFDPIIEEMYSLMQISFERFKVSQSDNFDSPEPISRFTYGLAG
eukprot:398459_1